MYVQPLADLVEMERNSSPLGRDSTRIDEVDSGHDTVLFPYAAAIELVFRGGLLNTPFESVKVPPIGC